MKPAQAAQEHASTRKATFMAKVAAGGKEVDAFKGYQDEAHSSNNAGDKKQIADLIKKTEDLSDQLAQARQEIADLTARCEQLAFDNEQLRAQPNVGLDAHH